MRGAVVLVVLFAVALGVILAARMRQQSIAARATGIYDRAFISMTYVDKAQLDFWRFSTRGLPGMEGLRTADSSKPLRDAIDDLDIMIERAGSSDVRLAGQVVRHRMSALEMSNKAAEASPDHLPEIALDLEHLARRVSAGGLRSRDDVERIAIQSDRILMTSLATTALAFGMMILLGWALRQRKRSLTQIAKMARTDTLTQLSNRHCFHLKLRASLALAARGHDFALLCIDLDGFKAVNDSFGHPVGDALLHAVAARLRAMLRGEDSVARLGGDEFAVITAPIGGHGNAATLGQRIIDTLSAPYEIGGQKIEIGASVGIALSSTSALDGVTLMRNSDVALYRAKQDGRGVVRVFEPAMDASARARGDSETKLRLGLERGEFEVFYRPLASTNDGKIVSIEARPRWNDPSDGWQEPAHFMPLAEEMGLSASIGDIVLLVACQEASHWPSQVSLTLRISQGQFASTKMVARVRAALIVSGLAPSRLELQTTERLLLDHGAITLAKLQELRGLGVRVSIHDCGASYAALCEGYKFPFDKLTMEHGCEGCMVNGLDRVSVMRAIAGAGPPIHSIAIADIARDCPDMQPAPSGHDNEVQSYYLGVQCQARDVAELIFAHAV